MAADNIQRATWAQLKVLIVACCHSPPKLLLIGSKRLTQEEGL